MPSANKWITWQGGDWDGDPDQLVHVMFRDGETDEHLPPTPARNLGLKGEVSNWRFHTGSFNSVIAYKPAA